MTKREDYGRYKPHIKKVPGFGVWYVEDRLTSIIVEQEGAWTLAKMFDQRDKARNVSMAHKFVIALNEKQNTEKH